MLTSILLTVLHFGSGASDPVARATEFFKHTPDFSVQYRVSINGRATFPASWLTHFPSHQKYSGDSGAEKFDFIQTPDGIIVIDNLDRSYHEYGPFMELVPPPSDAPIMLGFPSPLLNLVGGKLGKIKWQAPVKKVLGNTTVDLMTFHVKRAGNEFLLEMWIDASGLVKQIHTLNVGMAGKTDVVFSGLVYQVGGVNGRLLTNALPIGYVPDVAPSIQRTITAGTRAPFGIWTTTNGARVDMAKERKGKRTVILMTSPSCEPSKKGEAAWKELAEKLKVVDAELVEVSLGSDKPVATPVGHKLFTDFNGAIESLFQPPVTPYLFVVGKNGIVLRAWAGYNNDQAAILVKTILKAYSEADDTPVSKSQKAR